MPIDTTPLFPQMMKVGEITKAEGGAMLRDAFAMAALQGLLAAPDDGTVRTMEEHVAHYSGLAYLYADGCMAERAKGLAGD